ncbi:hypothetical protein BC937DRAFT_87786, partial [Endogone sp. FLAS-F59071]
MLPILLNHPSDPSNSETSERLLQVLAASPIATSILEDALNNDSMSDGWSIRIPYEGLRSEFRLSDLDVTLHLEDPNIIEAAFGISLLTSQKRMQHPGGCLPPRAGRSVCARPSSKIQLEE